LWTVTVSFVRNLPRMRNQLRSRVSPQQCSHCCLNERQRKHLNYQRWLMGTRQGGILAVAAVLVLGCSTTSDPTSIRLPSLRQESQEISERERQCINGAVIRSNEQLAQIAVISALEADTGLLKEIAANERDRELAECKAEAEQEEKQLSARERVEYARQAEDARERRSLRAILTGSPR
jgi:hypothetical protein